MPVCHQPVMLALRDFPHELRGGLRVGRPLQRQALVSDQGYNR
jgi:hypothetical protein